MKVVRSVLLAVLVISGSLFVSAGLLRAQTPSPAAAAGESVTISVKGMACMACVAKTMQTLRAVPGVSDVEVKLSPGSALIKYDPAQVTPEKLIGVIKKLGYEAEAPAPKKPE